MSSTIRQQIWEDMKTYKTYIDCCRSYTSKMRKHNRWLKGGIIFTTASGAVGFFFNEWCAFISTILACLAEVFQKLLPQLNQPEEELVKLDEIAADFEKTLIKIESIWNRYECNTISDEQVIKELSKLNNGHTNQKSLMNKYVRKISKKENLALQAAVDNYFKGKFYNYEE